MKITFVGDSFAQAERDGLNWLAARNQSWQWVEVKRRTDAEFDLYLTGKAEANGSMAYFSKVAFKSMCMREFVRMGLTMLSHEKFETLFDSIIEQRRAKPPFSREFLHACRYVWQAVAEEGHEYAENEDAIECILDADRLCMVPNAGEAANAELEWLDSVYGCEKVMQELGKVLQLV